MRFTLVLMLCLSATVSAKETVYPDFVISEVTSIYDADTFRGSVPGWPDIIGKRVPIRILGVDAPEIFLSKI